MANDFKLGIAKEALHKSQSVIASAAKQPIFTYQSITYGSPRRCAPRDDGLIQTFPKLERRLVYLLRMGETLADKGDAEFKTLGA
jgi:hypothetical protein